MLIYSPRKQYFFFEKRCRVWPSLSVVSCKRLGQNALTEYEISKISGYIQSITKSTTKSGVFIHALTAVYFQ